MSSLNKKIILIIIVIAEILVGSYFIYEYQQHKLEKNNVLGTSKISVFDKSKIIIEQNHELNYYYKLKPNEEWEEQPEWLSYKVQYRTNSDGLRDRDYKIKKPKDTYRILALGDSFTYGHHVNNEENWTEQLEVMLNEESLSCNYKNFEVINLGMAGYDVQHIVQRYKDYGEKYNPDLILWFDPGYGFSRHTELTERIIKNCYETSSEKDREKDDSKYYRYKRCSNIADQQIKEEYSDKELLKSIEHELDNFFNLKNTDKTIFIYYQDGARKEKKIIEKWQKKYRLATFINLVPNPIKEEQLPDAHPNSKGHKIIAINIFDYLKNTKINCK